MNLYITKLHGTGSPMRAAQCMTVELAHQLGFREMGIYHYNANAEAAGARSVRFDGIIAGMQAGDIVVCQFHTWNGLRFERGLVDHIKAYHGRVVIFIHSVEALMIKSSGFMLGDTVELYNQAEALIVPSHAMKRFLLESGIRAGMKFIVQEMWDCPTSMNFRKRPEFRRQIHCAGGYGSETVDNWCSDISLKVYSAIEVKAKNVYSAGGLNQEERLLEFSKGGFGLEWYHDEQAYRYMQYGNPLSLSPYLAAGIPVIVPQGISCQKLIEENHLGLAVNSVEEAVSIIESMNESDYQEYVRHVGQFAPALRSGFYTKKCLIDAVQALFREDIGKAVIQTADVFELDDFEFSATSLKESYGGNLALSWNMKAKPDGFLIYDSSGNVVGETENGYQHYFLLKGCEKAKSFIVKAYVDSQKGKMIVAKTGTVCLGAEAYEKTRVSIVIPAYNAEDTIARSIDMVLAQSFSDVEIIVVDDGSTDHTSDIVDWYAQNYQNIIVKHQKNAGVQAARNAGIKLAGGEFTAFMDSDDMIRPDMIERMYHSVIKNQCDIAVTSAYKIGHNGYETMIQYPVKEDEAMAAEEFLQMYAMESYALPALWNKLYRTSLLKEHLLPLIVYEDEAWTPYVLSYAEKICYLNACAYEYDRSACEGSLVDKWAGKSKDEVFRDHKRSILFYLEHGNTQKMKPLKQLADNELAYFARVMAYPEYEEVRRQINQFGVYGREKT